MGTVCSAAGWTPSQLSQLAHHSADPLTPEHQFRCRVPGAATPWSSCASTGLPAHSPPAFLQGPPAEGCSFWAPGWGLLEHSDIRAEPPNNLLPGRRGLKGGRGSVLSTVASKAQAGGLGKSSWELCILLSALLPPGPNKSTLGSSARGPWTCPQPRAILSSNHCSATPAELTTW